MGGDVSVSKSNRRGSAGIPDFMRSAVLLRAGCFLATLTGALAGSPPSHAQTTNTPVTYSTSQTVTNQIIGAGSVTVNGGATVSLSNISNNYSGGTVVNAASTLAVGANGELGATSGGVTLGDATFGGTLDLSSSSAAVTSSRAFTLDAGGGTILVDSNAWTLSGAITGTGGLTVSGVNGGSGNLILTNASNSFATGGLTINGNATVQAGAAGDLGGGTVTLGDSTYGGTLDVSTASGAVSASNAFVLNAGGGTILAGSGGTWTLSGLISGAGGLTVSTNPSNGAGTLILTDASNSYAGNTTVTGGATLQIGADGDLGSTTTGTVTLGTGSSTGTLDLTGNSTSARNFNLGGAGGIIDVGGANPAANTWTLSGGISGGPLTVNGGGASGGEVILSNTGSNGFSALTVDESATVGAVTAADLGGGTITLGDATYGGTLDLSQATAAVSAGNNIVLNAGGGTFQIGGTNAAANIWTLSGVISGAGNMTVTGGGTSGTGGTLILSGANTFTGNTSVNGDATLQIGADNNLGATTTGTVTLGDGSTGGTLSLTGGATSLRTIDLSTGGGTIDTSGGTWTFTNPVVNTPAETGALTVGGSGVLVLDGVNTYTGATDITGGTLMVGGSAYPSASIDSSVTLTGGTLSGYGTIIGSVTNNGGNVSPGVGGTLTVTGNYTQTAGSTTITVLPSSSSSSPILSVGGVASFTSGTTLNVDYVGNFHSQTIDLIGASSITGFGGLTVNDALSNSIGVTVQEIGGDEIELTLTQLALGQNPAIFPAITNIAIDEAQNDNDMVLTRLTDLRTEAVTDEMLMASSMYHRTGGSSGQSPYGAWMKALGGAGSIGGGDGSPGYTTQGEGFIAGLDTELSPGVVGGLALSYGHSSITQSDGETGGINTPRLMLYGGWWRGPIALDATLGYGLASLSSLRPTSGGTGTTSFTGGEFTAAVQASSPQAIGDIALTPAVGLDYARLDQDAASESGAGIYDVTSLTTTTNSLRPFLAATVATRYALGYLTKIEPQLRIAYEVEALGVSRAAQIEPVGDAQVFNIAGVTPSRGILDASAGIKIETSRALAFFADVSAMNSGNASGFGGDAGIRWRF
jgi:autotransporter-associated beta strand protein